MTVIATSRPCVCAPGLCCASLKDNKALMKMGLALVLVGHINFLLGALVHGAVLRHINVHAQARTMVYAISNVIAIVAGLFVSAPTHKALLSKRVESVEFICQHFLTLQGIIGGITAIVLSKNKKNRILVNTAPLFVLLCLVPPPSLCHLLPPVRTCPLCVSNCMCVEAFGR